MTTDEYSIPSISRDDFYTILELAEKDFKTTIKEFQSFSKEHKIPIREIIALMIIGIIPFISYLMNLNFFNPEDLNKYLLFWIIASFTVLLIKYIRYIKILPFGRMTQELRELDLKLKNVNKDEKTKTLFLAFGKMLFMNIKPFTWALSSIFFINIIILVYFYFTHFYLNSYYFWGILIISIAYFIIFFVSWKFIKLENFFPYLMLNKNVILEEFKTNIPKISKIKAISYLIFLLVIIIFILFLLIGPIILLYYLMKTNWIFLINHIPQFLIIFITLFLLITMIEVFLTRASVLKWLILKGSILDNNVVSPSKSIVLDSSSFLTNNLEKTNSIYKAIKLNYVKSMLFSITQINYHGFFTRYLIILNFSIINNDYDFRLLTEFLERD